MSRLPTSHPCDSEGEAVRNYMQVAGHPIKLFRLLSGAIFIRIRSRQRVCSILTTLDDSDFDSTANNDQTRDQSSSVRATAFPKQSGVSARCPEGYR
jgi:hypothetical protein